MHLFLKSRVVLVKIKACSTFGISNKLQIVYVHVLIVLSSEVHITIYYMYKKLCLTMNDQKWESSCMGWVSSKSFKKKKKNPNKLSQVFLPIKGKDIQQVQMCFELHLNWRLFVGCSVNCNLRTRDELIHFVVIWLMQFIPLSQCTPAQGSVSCKRISQLSIL